MDKFPILQEGNAVGEMSVKRTALYTEFTVNCRVPTAGLWGVWLVGEAGELRLGLLERTGNCGTLQRQFSGQMTARLGQLVRGDIRPVGNVIGISWERLTNPADLFRSAWLRQQLHGVCGAMFRRENRQLALPYDTQKPFPLLPWFCFARVCAINGKPYVVYCFDEKEYPVFP